MACSIKDKNNNKQNEGSLEIENLINKATVLGDSGEYKQAIIFIDSSIVGRKLSLTDQFKVLGFKAGTYHKLKDTLNEIIFVDSLLRIARKSDTSKYARQYALANYSKGDVLLMVGDYNSASHYYYTARQIAKSTLDSCAIGEYSYRIGMVLYQQERYNEAAVEFKQAFQESSTCAEYFVSYYRRQEILDNIALSYLETGATDSAYQYANRALQLITANTGKYPEKENFNEIAKGVVYGTIGRVHKQKGDYKSAKTFLKQSIDINSRRGNENQDAQFMQLQLAETYYLEDNVDSMNIVLANSRQSLDSIKNPAAKIEWTRLMWKYNEKGKAIGNAYTYLNKYLQLQDTAQRSSAQLNLSNVRKQVQLLESESQVNFLQKENEVKNYLLLLFSISMTLAVIIVVLFIYILRTTRKNVRVLQGLNEKIKKQKIELEQALQQLEERNNEKDRILRVVAHDLRTPAASTSMLTELIQSETDEGARREMLKLIKSSTDNSLKLISEILEATGTDISKAEIYKEEISVNELLKNTIALLRFKAAEKQQQILLYLLKDDTRLWANKERIERVLSNLITNAIKFSLRESEIQVKATDKGDAVEIMVQDQGIGIPDKLQSKVFNLFTEAKQTGTAGEKPYGLGLSICKQIVEEHGGKIWFESEANQGSSFYITLPKKQTL